MHDVDFRIAVPLIIQDLLANCNQKTEFPSDKKKSSILGENAL